MYRLITKIEGRWKSREKLLRESQDFDSLVEEAEQIEKQFATLHEADKRTAQRIINRNGVKL